MNETTVNEPTNAAAECCAEVDQCVRRNPATAILVALGAGLAIGLIVRALRPEPTPQYRVARLLEDLEDRLRDVTGPSSAKPARSPATASKPRSRAARGRRACSPMRRAGCAGCFLESV